MKTGYEATKIRKCIFLLCYTLAKCTKGCFSSVSYGVAAYPVNAAAYTVSTAATSYMHHYGEKAFTIKLN